MRHLVILTAGWGVMLACSACGPGDSGRGPTKSHGAASSTTSTPPPLETVTMEEEPIVPLEEKPSERSEPVGVPCPWATIWQKGGPKPLPVGGLVRPPKKRSGPHPVLPYRKTETRGTPVVEVVIGIDGRVQEAKLVQSFSPAWPEGEAALVEAIRQWKYEPTVIDGKAVSVCTKITMNVEWTSFSRKR